MSFFSNKGVMAGLALGGTALGVYNTLRGTKEQASQLKDDARSTLLQGNRDEEAQRREARRMLGLQAASFAQAGGGIDEGVMRQSAANAELDALNIRYGANVRASRMFRAAGQIKRQGRLLAGSQLLSGLALYGAMR